MHSIHEAAFGLSPDRGTLLHAASPLEGLAETLGLEESKKQTYRDTRTNTVHVKKKHFFL